MQELEEFSWQNVGLTPFSSVSLALYNVVSGWRGCWRGEILNKLYRATITMPFLIVCPTLPLVCPLSNRQGLKRQRQVAHLEGAGSFGGHPAARREEEHRPLVLRSSGDARGDFTADREP